MLSERNQIQKDEYRIPMGGARRAQARTERRAEGVGGREDKELVFNDFVWDKNVLESAVRIVQQCECS